MAQFSLNNLFSHFTGRPRYRGSKCHYSQNIYVTYTYIIKRYILNIDLFIINKSYNLAVQYFIRK